MMSSCRAMPRQKTLTSGLPLYDSSKADLAADGGDADAVAVAADAGDHPFEDAPVERHVGRAEPQRVEQRHGPRAHREDVADDPADAGGRALIGLDERRVVVRFDLEHRRQAVADVDGAGVFARALQHAAARCRQRPQVDARALVAAVLGPHHREDAELGEVGLAAHQLADAVVLVGGDAVAVEGGLVECGHSEMSSLGPMDFDQARTTLSLSSETMK